MSSGKKNKKVIFLTPYPLGVAPGQRFRFEQYLYLLNSAALDFKVLPFLSQRTHSILYKRGHYMEKIAGVVAGFIRRLYNLGKLASADFVFIFREATPLGPPIFEWVIAMVLRKKIIYDFDDAIWLANTSTENKLVAFLKWHGKVGTICRWSHKVSCGNAYLAEYARVRNPNVIVNPTTIDTENLHNPARVDAKADVSKIYLGWTGTHSTLFYLEKLVPVVKRLSEKYSQLKLLVIADKNPDWSLPCLEFVRWNKETEIEDLIRIDIGLMPLTEDMWSKGKCGFKALQYMSLGKPTLVSPVGVNAGIVDHELNGYHCSTENDWESYAVQLINNAAARIEMGKRGREKVISDYSVVSNASNFLFLFD